jgi:hypothetical protein
MGLISLCPDRSYGSGGVFQTLTVPSKLAEVIHSPSGLNATQEHADAAAAIIRYRQIGDAVAVVKPDRYADRDQLDAIALSSCAIPGSAVE